MAKWRWGILSTAGISQRVVPAIRRCADATLVAVASRSLAKAQAAAALYNAPKAFGSYEELLHSGEVNVVYNPLPNSLHLEWTLRCIEAGIPVLCEKPLTLSAAHAQRIAEASRRSGVPVAEAFMYRYHPVYRTLAELASQGRVGRVQTLHSDFSFLLDEADGLPAKGHLGGGALLDVGCYCVNFSRLLAGCEPLDVAAMARFAASGPGSPSWDSAESVPTSTPDQQPDPACFDKSLVGLMRFPGGLLASFTTSIGAAEQHRVEVRGETGVLAVERPWHPRPTESVILQRHGEPDVRFDVPGDDPYYLEVRHFLDVCSGQAAPLWPIEESVLQAQVMEALARSARSGTFERVQTLQ